MSSICQLATDESGLVTNVRYHDGALEKVHFESDRRIRLALVSNDGLERSNVVLSGVKYFSANDLREGNIISDVMLWPLAGAPDSVVERMAQAFNLVSVERVNAVGHQRMVFVLMCSYGAEILALVNAVHAENSA